MKKMNIMKNSDYKLSTIRKYLGTDSQFLTFEGPQPQLRSIIISMSYNPTKRFF